MLQRYRDELVSLVRQGRTVYNDMDSSMKSSLKENRERSSSYSFMSREDKNAVYFLGRTVREEYQGWYTRADATVERLAPNRLAEFRGLYIQEGLDELVFHSFYSAEAENEALRILLMMQRQARILESAATMFESVLVDLRRIVQADLFDTELDKARELASSGYHRPAVVIAAVVLEKHLAEVAQKHNIDVSKIRPTINVLSNLLRDHGVIDNVPWRHIQQLADIRNLCAHASGREPTESEVTDMVNGVERLITNLS